MLHRIDWSTPTNVLESIIRHEAVHEIRNWDDLKRRLAPADRRCFAFFHADEADEPLVFLEVALMRHMPAAIDEVLVDGPREEIAPESATVAVFYSISNRRAGLRGVAFGGFLIRQVVEDLSVELPGIADFVTLSPVTGLADWLAATASGEGAPGRAAAEIVRLAADPGWPADPEAAAVAARHLPALTAEYLLNGRTPRGRPRDSVARFHLGNGARVERVNVLGDRSAKAMGDSLGMMVNYRYLPGEIEANRERFNERGEVAAAPAVAGLLYTPR